MILILILMLGGRQNPISGLVDDLLEGKGLKFGGLCAVLHAGLLESVFKALNRSSVDGVVC